MKFFLIFGWKKNSQKAVPDSSRKKISYKIIALIVFFIVFLTIVYFALFANDSQTNKFIRLIKVFQPFFKK